MQKIGAEYAYVFYLFFQQIPDQGNLEIAEFFKKVLSGTNGNEVIAFRRRNRSEIESFVPL